MRAIFDKYKHELWPEIKNWSEDPPQEKYYETQISKLKTSDFIFFHPSGYKLYYYGVYPAMSLPFLVLILWLILTQKAAYFVIFPGLISLILLYNAVKHFRTPNYMIQGRTLYDEWLRDNR